MLNYLDASKLIECYVPQGGFGGRVRLLHIIARGEVPFELAYFAGVKTCRIHEIDLRDVLVNIHRMVGWKRPDCVGNSHIPDHVYTLLADLLLMASVWRDRLLVPLPDPTDLADLLQVPGVHCMAISRLAVMYPNVLSTSTARSLASAIFLMPDSTCDEHHDGSEADLASVRLFELTENLTLIGDAATKEDVKSSLRAAILDSGLQTDVSDCVVDAVFELVQATQR